MARRSRSFTIVEAAVSIIIVSVMLTAVVKTVAAARAGEKLLAERSRGLVLARNLVAEILQRLYVDPAYGLGSFGIGADELTGNRSLFDDVDDYGGWLASPPQNKDGSAVPQSTGYEESVSVAWVTANNLLQTSGSETGIKKIVVTLKYDGRVVATLTAWRTQSWTDPAATAGGAP
jgi:type II secretory pathway pseudopilin PulG